MDQRTERGHAGGIPEAATVVRCESACEDGRGRRVARDEQLKDDTCLARRMDDRSWPKTGEMDGDTSLVRVAFSVSP